MILLVHAYGAAKVASCMRASPDARGWLPTSTTLVAWRRAETADGGADGPTCLTKCQQERSLHQKKRPLAEMIFVTNSLGAVILLTIAGSGGELAKLQERMQTHPTAIVWLLATVVLAYGGSYAFTACIKGFGAVVATGVGICRKFVSVMASYTIFPKPFNVQHVFGILLFFSGMVLSWSQQASSRRANARPKAKRTASSEMQKLAGESTEASPGRTSDSSASADGDVDSDENLDSPSRAMLVATPHGTPGTPTTSVRLSRGRWGQERGEVAGEKQRPAAAWNAGRTQCDGGEADGHSSSHALDSPLENRLAPLGPR